MRDMRALALIVITGTGLAMVLAHCGGGSDPPAENALPLPERAIPDGNTEEPLDATPLRECDLSKPFEAPSRLPGLDNGVDIYATPKLSQDELTLYCTTIVFEDGGVHAHLVRATRTSQGSMFGQPTLMSAQNSPQNDHDPAVGSDHLSLWFFSTRSGNADLWYATRTTVAEDFGPPSLVPDINTPALDYHPYYRTEAAELWFASDRADAGMDIYIAKREDAGFGIPVRSELSSPFSDYQPAPTEDGLRVVFSSDREGGAGSFDLWSAQRSSVTEPFGAPTPLTEVNSTAEDFAGWLSPDGCRIYFSTNRDTFAPPRHRLWYAERPKK